MAQQAQEAEVVRNTCILKFSVALFLMCTGSSCEGEISSESLAEATVEESVLSVPKFGAAAGQPDSRQKQVRLTYM